MMENDRQMRELNTEDHDLQQDQWINHQENIPLINQMDQPVSQALNDDVISQGDESDNTSDTSSYISESEIEQREKELKSFQAVEDKMEMLDEFEEPSASTYAKFKTVNEIDPENVDKFAPPLLDLDDLDDILDFGVVDKYIEDGASTFLTVTPSNSGQIFDLDNLVCLKTPKQVIGFILDLIGPVNNPFYSVRLYPQFIYKQRSVGVELKNLLVGSKVYLVVKTLKMINSQLPLIMAKKGCDASNIYDEEVPEHDREFSDDEKEKECKKAKKAKRKQKRGNDQEMEEGEIEEEQKMTQKRKHHTKEKHYQSPQKPFIQRDRFGTQIPMYSTNYNVTQPQPSFPQYQQQQQYQHQQQLQQMGYQPFQSYPMFYQPPQTVPMMMPMMNMPQQMYPSFQDPSSQWQGTGYTTMMMNNQSFQSGVNNNGQNKERKPSQ